MTLGPANQILFTEKLSVHPAMSMPVQAQIRPLDVNHFYASSSSQDRLSLPPPVPPHRTPERGTDQVLLRPENRPLLPPSVSVTPFTCLPKDLQESLPPPPRVFRRRMGSRPSIFDSTVTLPTPKPRSHYADCGEGDQKEQGLGEHRSGWLYPNDIHSAIRPTSMPVSYPERRTSYRASRYPLRISESPKGRFTSSEHLEGVLAMTMPQRETEILQQCRSMTTLNYTTAEGSSMYESPMVVSNADDRGLRRVLDPWLPITDGRSRLLPVDVVASEAPSEGIPDATHKPTTQVDRKSQLVWQPLKFRQEEETTANKFTNG